jgi:serine/threonine-protein kinase
MMFSLLAGRYVHQAETRVEMLVKAATQPVESIGDACPEVPAPVRAVIERALAFDKGARWADATSMDAALALAFREVTGADVSTIVLVTAPDAGDHASGSGDGKSGTLPPVPVTGPAESFPRR